MKVSIFASVLCLFSGLVSSLAVPAAEPEAGNIKARGVAATIYPSLLVPIFEDHPNVAFGSYYFAEVKRVSRIDMTYIVNLLLDWMSWLIIPLSLTEHTMFKLSLPTTLPLDILAKTAPFPSRMLGELPAVKKSSCLPYREK